MPEKRRKSNAEIMEDYRKEKADYERRGQEIAVRRAQAEQAANQRPLTREQFEEIKRGGVESKRIKLQPADGGVKEGGVRERAKYYESDDFDDRVESLVANQRKRLQRNAYKRPKGIYERQQQALDTKDAENIRDSNYNILKHQDKFNRSQFQKFRKTFGEYPA